MIDIRKELESLQPIDLPSESSLGQEPLEGVVQSWATLSDTLRRLGKQQLRNSSVTDGLAAQVSEALESLRRALNEANERTQEVRRDRDSLREESERSLLRILTVADHLDDALIASRGREDPAWSQRLQRLLDRTLEVYLELGLSEIDVIGGPFDEETQEPVDLVEPSPGQDSLEVTQVVRRGYRHAGQVLRRAQVVTTR